jgi:hypothetical protein
MPAPTGNRRSAAVLLIVAALIIIGLGTIAITHHAKASATSIGNTLVGHQGNTNPEGPGVTNWAQLEETFNNNSSYQGCEQSRLNVPWTQVQQYADLVKQGHQLNAILISNSSMTPAQAVTALEGQGYTNVAGLPVITASEGTLMNTARDPGVAPNNTCFPFIDNRAQVRLILTIPIDVTTVSNLPKGVVSLQNVRTDEFNLGECSNQANIVKPVPAVPSVPMPTPVTPTPGTPPTPRPTPPTVPTTPPTVPTTTPPTVPTTTPTTTGCPNQCRSVDQPPASSTTATSVPGSSIQPADPVIGPPAVEGTAPTKSTGGQASGSNSTGSAPTGAVCPTGQTTGCVGGGPGGGSGSQSQTQSGQTSTTPVTLPASQQ